MDITTFDQEAGMTTGRRTFTAGGVLGLAIFIWACDSGTRSSVEPSPNAPATVPTPTSAGNGESINGVVYDSGLRPIAGARVEFLDGPQAGMSTTADAKGGLCSNLPWLLRATTP